MGAKEEERKLAEILLVLVSYAVVVVHVFVWCCYCCCSLGYIGCLAVVGLFFMLLLFGVVVGG